MVSAVLWQTTPVSRGTILTSADLTGLANNGIAQGSAYDNSSNLDQYCYVEFNGQFASGITAGGYLNVYRSLSLDGTNYASTYGTVNWEFVTALPLSTSTAGTQRVQSRLLMLPPTTMKWAIENKTGVATCTDGQTLKLFTVNDEGQ